MKTTLRSLLAAILLGLLLSLSACGGVGGGSTSPPSNSTPPIVVATEDVIVTKINDPNVPLIGIVTDNQWKEKISFSGTKDAGGNAPSLTEIHYSSLGIDIQLTL